MKAIRTTTSSRVQDYRALGIKGRLNKIISEAAAYGLIMQSRKPEAKLFQEREHRSGHLYGALSRHMKVSKTVA
jgi:hypothetical protein